MIFYVTITIKKAKIHFCKWRGMLKMHCDRSSLLVENVPNIHVQTSCGCIVIHIQMRNVFSKRKRKVFNNKAGFSEENYVPQS